MAVEGLRERYFREPLLELLTLVPQFMRRVDPHTGNHAGSHRERELLPAAIGAFTQHHATNTSPTYWRGRNKYVHQR